LAGERDAEARFYLDHHGVETTVDGEDSLEGRSVRGLA